MTVKEAIAELKRHDPDAMLVFRLWKDGGPIHYLPHASCGETVVGGTCRYGKIAVAFFADNCMAHMEPEVNESSVSSRVKRKRA